MSGGVPSNGEKVYCKQLLTGKNRREWKTQQFFLFLVKSFNYKQTSGLFSSKLSTEL